MSDDDANRMAQFLYDHPRAMGVLFALVMATSQVGTAVAGDGNGITGP